MKKGSRVLAVDDSPFQRGRDTKAFLVGLLFRDLVLEKSVREIITVDGEDSTDALVRMIEHPKIKGEARLVLTHGTTFGGLNLLNMQEFFEKTGVPIIAVASREPTNEIETALKSAGLSDRAYLLHKNPPYTSLYTPKGTCYYSFLGLSRVDTAHLLIRFSLESKIPEQLRVVDIVAKLLEGLAPIKTVR